MTKYISTNQHTSNTSNISTTGRIRGGMMKQLLTTAALCVALGAGTPTIAMAAAETTATEQTLQTAYDQLIADAKSSMMADPASALEHADAAESLVRSAAHYSEREAALTTAMWLKAEALNRAGKPETAATVVAEALERAEKNDLDTALCGDLLLAQGRIAQRLADVETAVKAYFKAYDMFTDAGDLRKQAISLQQLGGVYRDAEAYEQALDYYKRAEEIYAEGAGMQLAYANNQGNILKDLGRYDEARQFFTRAYAVAKEMDSKVLEGRILTNMAETETRAGEYAVAKSYTEQAHAAFVGEDGVEWDRFATGVDAHIALKSGDIESAEAFIDAAFDGVDVAATSMNYEPMHDTAYQVYMLQGDYAEALAHHQSFKRLSDNAKKVASSANLALLGAQFQFAEQNLNIEQLKNDQLKTDMMLSDAKRQKTFQTAVIAVGGIILLSLFIALLGFRNHRNRIAASNRKLETTVDQLNSEIGRRELVERDLILAKDQAEAANRAKSTFLATMSHELRTPMNGILGFSRLLKSGDVDNEQLEQLDIIEQSGESLLGLINDILDLSQIEAGKLNLDTSAFNLKNSIENVVKLLKPKADEKNLTLAAHIDPRLPAMVDGDGGRVRQIVMNLVGNAVKFTETGSVAVIAKPGAGDNTVRIGILDTGIGIPADKLNTLFDRFSQVDGSTTRKHGGSGLGLAICKELAEAMGGDVTVKSVLGEGSEFWVEVQLPAAIDMAAIERAPVTLEEPARVVVVDNNNATRVAYEEMLPTLNVTPVMTDSVESAIETLMVMKSDGEMVDAVIVSDQVDGAHAKTVANAMRRNLLAEGAKLILSSPRHLSDAEMSVLGFDGQIDQPLTNESVFAGLAAVLGGAPVEEEAPTNETTASDNVVTFLRAPSVVEEQRVLIVDDVMANSKLIAALLSPLNLNVDLAESGAEAVEAAENADYDLILMDVFMPDMNGIEATKRIRRKDCRNAQTPILALTAMAMADDEQRVLDAGMDDYLSKPVDMNALRAKVQTHLENSSRAKKAKVSSPKNDVAADLQA